MKPAGPSPVIMFVHGGGWVAGTKTGTPGMSYFLESGAARLFHVLDRLSAGAHVDLSGQHQRREVRGASHARECRKTTTSIRIASGRGARARADIWCRLLGTSDQSAGWDVGQYLDQSSRVQVVVDMYGIHDLTTEYVVGNVRGLDRMVFGAKSPTDPILEKASPVHLHHAR